MSDECTSNLETMPWENAARKGCLGLVIVGLFFFGVSWLLASLSFAWTSCCSHCGMRQSSHKIGGLTVYQNRDETPLSRSATVRRLVGEHEHDWRFIHGGGGSISCAIGDGGQFSAIANDSNFAVLLDRVLEVLGDSEAQRLLKAALDPNSSRAIRSWFTIPSDTTVTKDEDFRSWYNQAWIDADGYLASAQKQ